MTAEIERKSKWYIENRGGTITKVQTISGGNIKYFKMTLMYDNQSQGSYIEKLDNILEMFREMLPDSGDTYVVEAVEMEESEYEKLPEFMGF